MKKKLFFSLLTISLLALTSCKKDYNCVCSAGGFSAESETYENVKKSDAESRCEDYEEDVQSVNSSVSCSINETD